MKASSVPVKGYIVHTPSEKEQGELLGHVIPRRRGPTPSVPGVSMAEGLLMGDEMYAFAGYDEYLGLCTAEMKSRPVPQVFPATETKRLDSLFDGYYGDLLYQFILPNMRAPYQTYQKTSKVGWPGFFIPNNKTAYVMSFMPEVLAGDLSRFDASFITMNVRLQVDPISKVRDYQFVDSSGGVYGVPVDAKFKGVKTPAGPRTASRTRNVFNLMVTNLIAQPYDSAVIDLYNKWPAFHHNIFGNELLPVKGEQHICLDVKMFERATATCNRIRAAYVGGVYGAIKQQNARVPFCCPTDDWKGARMLYVDRSSGFSEQYASGDSAVAPSQKEILHIIYASFFEKYLGYTRANAIRQVAVGGEPRLTIRNFGDDNSIDGDSSVLRDFMQYAGEFLNVEEENPPKFLGFVWYGNKWQLPVISYLTKTYENERRPGSNFRKYPFLGWVERRNIYRKLGHPDIVKIWEKEDQLLARIGLPWYRILELADKERREAFFAKEDATNPYMLQNKEYLLTPMQQKALGTVELLEPAATGPIIKKLVSKNVASKLQF